MLKRFVLWATLAGAAWPLAASVAAAQQPRPSTEIDRAARRRSTGVDPLRGLNPTDPVTRVRAAVYAVAPSPVTGEPMVGAFLRVRPSAEAALRARGVEIGIRAGGWVTARVPLARWNEIVRLPEVQRVEPSRRAHPVDDTSMPDIGATQVRDRQGLDLYEGSTGRGAIVGIVDTGIDWRHPDFYEDDRGRSRILYLWDQTLSGKAPGFVGQGSDTATFAYGYECTGAELNPFTGSCPSRDVIGHGTHVAGTAAGDGSAARHAQPDYSLAGVAPQADLIVVRTDFSFVGIAEGVSYVFNRAAALGRPAVVNLSLGAQYGPHDGSEVLSLVLDSLSGPGKIVVAAAGNEGANGGASADFPLIHADGSAPVGDSVVVDFTLPSYSPVSGSGNDYVLMQAFYDSTDRFDAVVVRPDGSRVTIPFGQSTSSTTAAGTVVGYDGPVAGDTVLGPDLTIGDLAPKSPSMTAEVFIGDVVTGGTAPSSGTWRLVFRRTSGTGSGVVDAYLPEVSINAPTAIGFGTGAANRKLVGTPGDARSVITVGGYKTRQVWPSVDGNSYMFTYDSSYAVGSILLFSSPGPARDGRLKPDISAPGRVLSSRSRDATGYPNNLRALISPDSAHVLMEGTSMATPHVTGAVALLLAERPQLTPDQVRSALAASARHDQFTALSYNTGEPPQDLWGAGKLSVNGALQQIGGPVLAGRATGSGNAGLDTASRVQSKRGTLLPLQSVRIEATDAESLKVVRIGATVTGVDRAFRLGVVVDANRNRVVDAGETVLASSDTVDLEGSHFFEIALGGSTAPVVPRGGTVDLLLVGELSGQTPHGTQFSATYDPDSTAVVGMRTAVATTLTGRGTQVASVRTTVLAGAEQLNVTQNPVRRSPLIVNTAQGLRRLDVYDFAGRLVRSYVPGSADCGTVGCRWEWDLRTENGADLANGAYVFVFDFQSNVIRKRIFVAR